jgi:hypothetical protein
LIPIARFFIRTSSFPVIPGRGISEYSKTSGPPVLVICTAFINLVVDMVENGIVEELDKEEIEEIEEMCECCERRLQQLVKWPKVVEKKRK